MKIIEINNCSECPHSNFVSCGTRFICNNSKVMVEKPYSESRIVNDKEIPKWCPLK